MILSRLETLPEQRLDAPHWRSNATAIVHILVLAALSVSGYVALIRLIPIVSQLCVNAGLHGRDLLKRTGQVVPEALGMVTGVVYLVCVIMFQPWFHYMLGEYNAALISICFMLLLGFADDVLDLRWSVKIFLSFMATFPLLVGYSGPTNIIVPLPVRAIFGFSMELGVLYHLYMGLFAVFCTNAINIYAGLNGLEVGQSLVIAVAVVVHNVLELPNASHLLSIFLTLPFIACSLALFHFNRYPSRVFVGDSYTYFAGATLAVAGILGHFSKTLMLFFVPQLVNFALSLPQLLRIVPCPRHRVPQLDESSGKLRYTPNYTLINLYLYALGPQTEDEVVRGLLGIQVLCCLFALFVRHYLSTLVY